MRKKQKIVTEPQRNRNKRPVKKGVVKNLAILTEIHMYRSLLFTKVAHWSAAASLN